jgi:hypothetical protein
MSADRAAGNAGQLVGNLDDLLVKLRGAVPEEVTDPPSPGAGGGALGALMERQRILDARLGLMAKQVNELQSLLDSDGVMF